MVVEKKDVGGAAAVSLTFHYSIAGVFYEAQIMNEPFEVGDSVNLMYLPEAPDEIVTERFVKGE